MSLPSNPIDDFFNKFKQILSYTLEDTGFGHLEIDCDRVNKQDKFRIILRGSTHYHYVFNNDDLKKWLSNKE